MKEGKKEERHKRKYMKGTTEDRQNGKERSRTERRKGRKERKLGRNA